MLFSFSAAQPLAAADPERAVIRRIGYLVENEDWQAEDRSGRLNERSLSRCSPSLIAGRTNECFPCHSVCPLMGLSPLKQQRHDFVSSFIE